MKLYDKLPQNRIQLSDERAALVPSSVTSNGKIYTLMITQKKIGTTCLKWNKHETVGVFNSLLTQSAIEKDFPFLNADGLVSNLSDLLSRAEHSAYQTHTLTFERGQPCQFNILRGEATTRSFAVVCKIKKLGTKENWTNHKVDVKAFYIPDAYNKKGIALTVKKTEDLVWEQLRTASSLESLSFSRYLVAVNS